MTPGLNSIKRSKSKETLKTGHRGINYSGSSSFVNNGSMVNDNF